MSSSAKRDMSRRANTHTLELFCSDFEMAIRPLNNGYQLRVEGIVDFYPTNGRYCILKTGERGDWNTAQDIRAVMLKALDKPSQPLIDNWAGATTITIPSVKTMTEQQYNKWYRRLWRWLQRGGRR